jgi:hypothetical protein
MTNKDRRFKEEIERKIKLRKVWVTCILLVITVLSWSWTFSTLLTIPSDKRVAVAARKDNARIIPATELPTRIKKMLTKMKDLREQGKQSKQSPLSHSPTQIAQVTPTPIPTLTVFPVVMATPTPHKHILKKK